MSFPEPSNEPVLSASEVAEFVYCQQAWFLGRQGAPVSPEAIQLREAGRQWQDQNDATLFPAVHTQQQAYSRSRRAWLALLLLILIVLWGLYALFSPRPF